MTLESEGKRPARHSVWRAHLRDRDSAYERTTRLGASLSHRAVPSRHGGMFGLRRLQEVRRPHVVGLSMRPHPVRSPDPASVTRAALCTRPPSSYAAVRLGWVVPSQLSPLPRPNKAWACLPKGRTCHASTRRPRPHSPNPPPYAIRPRRAPRRRLRALARSGWRMSAERTNT